MKTGISKIFKKKDAYARRTPSGNVAGYYEEKDIKNVDVKFAVKTLERFCFEEDGILDEKYMTEERCKDEEGRKFVYNYSKYHVKFGISFFQDEKRLIFTIY